MLRAPVKRSRPKNARVKETDMTRTDVRKIAWTLRLIGYGMLVGAGALMFLGAQHASASSSRTAPPAPFVAK